MSVLVNGQVFPNLEVPAVGGGTISLPDDLAGSYGVVLIYRGAWWPYCNAQLGAFARASDSLASAGIRVVALSVDDEVTTAALADKRGLTFPLGYGADAGARPSIRSAACQRPLHMSRGDPEVGNWRTEW